MATKMVSYATQSGSLGTSAYLYDPQAQAKLEMVANQANKVPEPTWLLEKFPSVMEAGNLVVINGDVFIYGLSLTNVLSVLVGMITIPLMLYNFWSDRKERKERRLREERKEQEERKDRELRRQALSDDSEDDASGTQ